MLNIQKIKQIVTVQNLINSLNVERKGGYYLCPECPTGKPPALKIFPGSNSFHCFRCKTTNPDVISLYKLYKGLSTWKDAAFALAEEYNIGLTKEDKKYLNEKHEDESMMYKFLQETHKHLMADPKKLVPLKERGVTDKTIKDDLIGFSEKNKINKLNYGESWKRKGLYYLVDAFIFPFNINHKNKTVDALVAWTNDDPKYLFTKGPKPIMGSNNSFKKGQIPPGGNAVLSPELAFVILTEGYFDFNSSRNAGYNTMATCGKISKNLAEKIHIFTNVVFLAFDNDKDGIHMTATIASYLIRCGKKVFIIKFPEEKMDLDKYLMKEKTLEKADVESALEWFCKRYKSSREKPDEKNIFKLLSSYTGLEKIEKIKLTGTLLGYKEAQISKALNEMNISYNDNIQPVVELSEYEPVKDWEVTHAGLFLKGRRITTNPMFVADIGKVWNSPNRYALVKYKSEQGRWESEIVPKGDLTDSRRLIKLNDWLPVTSENRSQVVNFFDAFISRNKDKFTHFNTTDKLGWHGDAFVFPDETISLGKEEFVYTGNTYKSTMVPKGNWETWRNEILNFFKGHRKNQSLGFRFALYAGIASIALEHLKFHPITINIFQEGSGKGKTTTLHAIMSMYGDPETGSGITDTWMGTHSGIIRSMVTLNNIPKGIDELSIKGDKSVIEWLYDISAGSSKTKAVQDSSNAISEKGSFRNIVFSTGERPLTEGVERSGAKFRGWELKNPFTSKHLHNEVVQLTTVIKKNYGHAIRKFIPIYLKNKNKIKDQYFIENYRRSVVNGNDGRILNYINCIYNVGRLFVEEVLKFDGEIVEKDCKAFTKTLLEQLGTEKDDITIILEEIISMYESKDGFFGGVVQDSEGKFDWKWYGEDGAGKPNLNYGSTFHGFRHEKDLYIKTDIFNRWIKEIFAGKRGKTEINGLLKNEGILEDTRVNLQGTFRAKRLKNILD